MGYVVRHPVLILMLLCTAALSYFVYAKAIEEPARGGFGGGFGGGAPLVGLTQTLARSLVSPATDPPATNSTPDAFKDDTAGFQPCRITFGMMVTQLLTEATLPTR